MREFVVTGQQAGFGVGATLALTREQIEPRRHQLRPSSARRWKGKDRLVCEVVQPVQFKRGEVIGADPDDVSKAHLAQLGDPAEEAAKAEAAKAAIDAEVDRRVQAALVKQQQAGEAEVVRRVQEALAGHQDAVQAEVQRRVEEALAKHGKAAGDGDGAKQGA